MLKMRRELPSPQVKALQRPISTEYRKQDLQYFSGSCTPKRLLCVTAGDTYSGRSSRRESYDSFPYVPIEKCVWLYILF